MFLFRVSYVTKLGFMPLALVCCLVYMFSISYILSVELYNAQMGRGYRECSSESGSLGQGFRMPGINSVLFHESVVNWKRNHRCLILSQ